MNTFFVTGIDTDIGKTYITGLLAKYLLEKGKSVVTQKLVQTGCKGISEDIIVHRKIMGIPLYKVDKNKITCPYSFSFPASPHLSSEMEKINIDMKKIDKSTETLKKEFKFLLIEGAGGVMVPLTRKRTTLDFISERNYPIIIVSSPKLGSINHTLLTINAIKSKNLEIKGIIYNTYPDEKREIMNDSVKIFKDFLPNTPIITVPKISIEKSIPKIDFSKLFE